MAREKQINESKELIENSLIRLLKKKPLNNISMTEIAEEAEVVRMTLYRHFRTKEEIILSIIAKKIDHMINGMNQNTLPTMHDFLLLRFHILKKSPFTEMLFAHNHLDKLLSLIRVRTIDRLNFLPLKDFSPFVIEFIGGGIDAITIKWVAEGMNESPESMTRKTEELIVTISSFLR